MFTPDENIFSDEYPLRENYQPEQIQERDNELKKYRNALQPVINGAPPKNIFLYGKTGVGKTVATNYLLDHLQEDAGEYGIDLTVIKQPCNNISSSYQVAVNLLNQLRGPDSRVSTTGYPQQDVFNMLYDELDELGGTVLIVLDEIDNIGGNDDILYELPRAESNGYVDDVWPGIIGISNDFTFRDQLSPKVKDTLCEEEIHFPPYDANELTSILGDRAEKAFHDGVLNDEVIPLAAAFSAQDSGSARQGLRLLHKAGELARSNEASTVEEKHIRSAQKELERDQLEDGMRELTTQGHLVLCSVSAFEITEVAPVRTQEIYERYQNYADRISADALGERRIRDHLSELSLHGFLTVAERNDGFHGGSYYEYELNVDLGSVLAVLSEISRLEDIPEMLESAADREGLT
ncbi:orc1/cdc6 family replication initiation protein [Halogeometricum sp. S1BR25-6]|uniref:ORC1-type DNA replication protein n=2 Tax=Halogeometricum salsisoli TaxID=2950536 RepID=A0ABU2GKS0_9EURY|nr:orc1/cdc6 family replication initiation protein [Halogeometricum sp. S1BR25-6]MDS0300981.1 orc1/cdc6 family replication initiation protein [Halogeometricum sp. S1BR25-6]